MFKVLSVAFSAVLAVSLLGVAPSADAKRMGGGSSMGRQAAPPSKPAPAQATPAPATPAGQPAGAAAAPAKAAAPAAAAASPARSWMGPVAGLAAGLGLAALASYMGFGEELANMMLILLMVIVGFIVVRLILSRMRGPQPAGAGAGAGGSPAGNFRMGANDDASQYNRAPYGQSGQTGQADDQGFGASANNWGQPMANMASSVPQPSQAEIDQFLNVAKGQFTSLQKLWDSGDLNQIKGFCTEAMAAELAAQLSERQGGNHTSVVSLQADWLGLDHTQDDDGHAVEEVQILFHGLIRESAEAAADPFNEIWTLHKRRDGSSGWLLAGITQQ